jgi:Uma2 family endonuclease
LPDKSARDGACELVATKTLLTIEQYNALDEPVGVRYELDRGELIVSPSAAPRDQLICIKLNSLIDTWVAEHDLGMVAYELDVRLAEDTVRRPDLLFVRRERMKGIDLDQVPLPTVPDLVIEVVLKFDKSDDLMLKVRQYRRAGVRAVWLFYAKTKEAHRYTLDALHPSVYTGERGNKFEEPESLPGFSLQLCEIFL